jgi:hypothetical protein
MSGGRRLSREGDRKPSILPFRLSKMNFGLIAMVSSNEPWPDLRTARPVCSMIVEQQIRASCPGF